MKIEFTKGRERTLTAEQIKKDKDTYRTYLRLCAWVKSTPITFAKYFGYQVTYVICAN